MIADRAHCQLSADVRAAQGRPASAACASARSLSAAAASVEEPALGLGERRGELVDRLEERVGAGQALRAQSRVATATLGHLPRPEPRRFLR